MNDSIQSKIIDSLTDEIAKLKNKVTTLELVVRSMDAMDFDKRIRKLENKLDIKVVK